MGSTPSRIAFLAGALATAFSIQALVSLKQDAPPTSGGALPTVSAPQPGPAVRSAKPSPVQPEVNYRGRIYVIRDLGEDHVAPEVFPRRPLDIVIDDCSKLELFDVDDSGYDVENHLVILSWWDPGVEESRSLTILTNNRSCAHLMLDRPRPDAP